MVSIISLKQNFFMKNVFSDAVLRNCGVPQGSILGPPLFLIYIINLPQALKQTGSYLYADNTCIFYQDNNVEKTERVVNKQFLDGLWTKSYQFILGMIKQKQFFFFE